jgi:heptosyltransferase II
MPANSASSFIDRDRLVGRLARAADRVLRPRHRLVQPHPSSVRRVAIVLPCCLGDLLMATPAIRALNQHYSRAEIVIVTQRWAAPAIESNPRVAGMIEFPGNKGPGDLTGIALKLRRERFDLGVSLDRSPTISSLLSLAGMTFRAGIDNRGRGVGLSHRATPEPRQHETELYLSVLKPLGIVHEQLEPEFFVPDDAVERVRGLVPRSDTAPLVVIHPGGAVNPGAAVLEKRWPATSFGELAALLIRERGATVVLVGAESDRSAVDTVRDFARAPVIDLCQQLSLAEVGAVCKQASLFVGNDSGVTHLASAAGTPTVALFGPTSPRRYRPLGRNAIVCAPPESWEIDADIDLRRAVPTSLPDIATVPLPLVFNTCLDLIDGAVR